MAAKKHELLGESKDVKFKHWKDSTYRKNTASGYKSYKWQAHHVIPGTSMEQSLVKFLQGKPDGYKKALSQFTNWNLNTANNMLGLPTATSYRKAYGAKSRSDGPFGLPAAVSGPIQSPTLPVHTPVSFGHTDYNGIVRKKLDSVWGSLGAKFENHEPIEAKDLGQQIQAISNRYRAILEAKRGQNKEDWDAEKFGKFRMA